MAAPGRGVPVALTTFIGRDRERVAVRGLLDDVRLITLIGAAGCGKTRLAAEVARERCPDARWVDLQPVTDVAGVEEAMLGAVGARSNPEAPIDSLVAALQDTEPLLVVDNCEQVLDDVARIVAEILRGAPGVSIIATSREPLGAPGEVTWRVPPLAVPPDRPDVSAADVLATDGGRLFVERARAANPAFVLDDADAPAAARLLHRLDGLPLALELAATRTRTMGVPALADALDDRFDLLIDGDRTADARHRTLLASVQWSHDLLSVRERTLFRRLAVFSSPFTARSAEAVAAGDGLTMDDVLPLLVRLADRSLVALVSGPDLDRYRMLETIRAYALDRLEDAGELARAYERHAAFFAARAAASADGLDGPEHRLWLERIDVEIADFDTARRWSIAHGQPDVASRSAAHLARYWTSRSRFVAGERAFTEVLALPDVSPAARAPALWGAAHLALEVGDLVLAVSRAGMAIPLAADVGDDRTRARALATFGSALSIVDPDAADPMFVESATLARSCGDLWCLAEALQFRGLSLVYRADLALARQLLDQARGIALEIGDETRLAWHEIGLGWLASRAQLLDAERHLRAAVTRAESLGEQSTASLAIAYLAEVLAWQGRGDEALALLQPAVDHLERAGGGRTPLGPLQAQLGQILLLGGRAEDALALFEETASDPRLTQLPTLRAQADLGLGAALAALGRPDAEAKLSAAIDPDVLVNRWLRCLGILLRSVVRRRNGQFGAAEDAATGLELAVESGYLVLAVEALDCVAALAARQDPAPAARLVGATRMQRRVRHMFDAVPGFDSAADTEARARPMLGDAVWQRLEGEGAQLGVDDAVALGRSLLDRSHLPSSPRPALGWRSLTPAEARVAELAARGLSNPLIAAELHVSRETVKTHLSHVFAKVGVGNRAELAAEWARNEER